MAEEVEGVEEDGVTEGARSREAGGINSRGRVMEGTGTRAGEDMVGEGGGEGITISRMEAIKGEDTKGDIMMVVIEVGNRYWQKNEESKKKKDIGFFLLENGNKEWFLKFFKNLLIAYYIWCINCTTNTCIHVSTSGYKA